MRSLSQRNEASFLGWSPKVVSALVIAIALLASVPLWAESSVLFRVGVFLTGALLALSFNLVFGYTGMISFGHGALFALGAYSSAILLRADFDWLVAMSFGVAVGTVAGFVFGVIALRASGIYFAVLTLALGEIVYRVLLHWTSLTGGENGLPGVRAGTLLSVSLGGPWRYYYFMLIVTVASAVLMRLLTVSRFGRTLRAVKSNPVRASYLGIHVHRYQILSFSISSAFAALAGVLYGPWSGILTPTLARWDRSAEPILATLLGGSGNFLGPVIGSGFFEFLNYLARDLQSLRIVATGVVLLVIILLVPGGLVNLALRRTSVRTDDTDRGPAAPEVMPDYDEEAGS